MTEEELKAYIRTLVALKGGQNVAAKEWGISCSYLNDIIQRDKAPGKKILDAMGLQREIRYVTKESR